MEIEGSDSVPEVQEVVVDALPYIDHGNQHRHWPHNGSNEILVNQ
jgi:hypothetical protein